MKIEQAKLIKELREMTKTASMQVLDFNQYSSQELNFKASANEWSVLECLEHLYLYGKFYLPEIEQRLENSTAPASEYFRTGILGNFFVDSIKATNKKKLKATKEMDTTGSKLSAASIHQLAKQLEWLDTLLLKAETSDLNKIKTNISLSKFIKLRLGDTLRFLVYHNERHIIQAQKAALQYPRSL